MAGEMLSQWNEAAKDIHAALNIDHDEQKSALLEKVLFDGVHQEREDIKATPREREDIKVESERQSCKAGARDPTSSNYSLCP
ncbi:hypothetical protein OROMI_010117 [Orobanche minor]